MSEEGSSGWKFVSIISINCPSGVGGSASLGAVRKLGILSVSNSSIIGLVVVV
jgi:hypothetical protein